MDQNTYLAIRGKFLGFLCQVPPLEISCIAYKRRALMKMISFDGDHRVG